MRDEYEFHPIADLFPLIDGEEFDALCADVKKNGLRQNISIYEGKILDGRNRYRACKAVGEDIRTVPFYGDDPFEYVTAQNLLRRHIGPSQRALIAAEMANMKAGDNQHTKQVAQICATSSVAALKEVASTDATPTGSQAKEVAQICATSQQQAANLLNVSRRSVQSASQVLSKGAPELVAAVRSDRVSISAAAAVVTLPVEEQVTIVSEGPAAVTEAAREIRGAKKPDAVADAQKPRAPVSRAPTDRVSILSRYWFESTPWQRHRFIENASPSVFEVLEQFKRGEF